MKHAKVIIFIMNHYHKATIVAFRPQRAKGLISFNINIPQMSLVRASTKSTVETILKQLEYVIKRHIAMQTILF